MNEEKNLQNDEENLREANPESITTDETLNNNIVTIRNRDTMEQEKINVDEIENYISSRIKF